MKLLVCFCVIFVLLFTTEIINRCMPLFIQVTVALRSGVLRRGVRVTVHLYKLTTRKKQRYSAVQNKKPCIILLIVSFDIDISLCRTLT